MKTILALLIAILIANVAQAGTSEANLLSDRARQSLQRFRAIKARWAREQTVNARRALQLIKPFPLEERFQGLVKAIPEKGELSLNDVKEIIAHLKLVLIDLRAVQKLASSRGHEAAVRELVEFEELHTRVLERLIEARKQLKGGLKGLELDGARPSAWTLVTLASHSPLKIVYTVDSQAFPSSAQHRKEDDSRPRSGSNSVGKRQSGRLEC